MSPAIAGRRQLRSKRIPRNGGEAPAPEQAGPRKRAGPICSEASESPQLRGGVGSGASESPQTSGTDLQRSKQVPAIAGRRQLRSKRVPANASTSLQPRERAAGACHISAGARRPARGLRRW